MRHVNGVLVQRAFNGERNLAINQRKQRMVFTNTNIHTGVKTSAALANNDAALRAKLDAFRAKQTEAARGMVVPPVPQAAG